MSYKHIPTIADRSAVPSEGILSRTIYDDNDLRAVWFGFAPGEELSEHTTSMPAVIQIVHGESDIVVGGEPIDGHPGTWVHMAAHLPHSIHARTPTIMLLLMLKSAT
jgi:quercetin dioxygenase-like cupin family protein